MPRIEWWKAACEYLGGERDEPPSGLLPGPHSMMWGFWWGLLGGAIVLFCGQSSKFIYIDF